MNVYIIGDETQYEGIYQAVTHYVSIGYTVSAIRKADNYDVTDIPRIFEHIDNCDSVVLVMPHGTEVRTLPLYIKYLIAYANHTNKSMMTFEPRDNNEVEVNENDNEDI